MRKPSEEKINRILGYSAPVLFVGAMVWGFMMHSWLQPGLKDPLKVTVPEEPAPASAMVEPQGGAQGQEQSQDQTGQQPQNAESEEAGRSGDSPDATDKAGSAEAGAGNSTGSSTGNRSSNGNSTATKPKNSSQSAPVLAPPTPTQPTEQSRPPAATNAEDAELPPVDYDAMYGGRWEAADREVDSQTQLREDSREDPREATDPAGGNTPGDKAEPEMELRLSPPLAEPQTQRKYGLSYSPFHQDYRFHGGVDLSAEEGEEVYLTAAGRISEITYTEDEKYRIVVEHAGGWTTVYSQLDQIYVESGQSLEQNQPLGKIADPGSTEPSAPHLHWELWYQGERMNPMEYLQ